MNKYIITINCKNNNEICFYANNVVADQRYSVSVDGNIITFKYPVVSIKEVLENEENLRKYVLYFKDGSSRIIECVNGRYNPEDPYTFLHNSGTYEFEKPIVCVEASGPINKCDEPVKERESNCLERGQYVTLHARTEDIPIKSKSIKIKDRLTITSNGKPLELESPVVGFTTRKDSIYQGTIFVEDGLAYFINFTEHVNVSPNIEIFDGVEFIFDSPASLDIVHDVNNVNLESDETKESEIQFCRKIFTPAAVDVFFDKLYIIALEKDMLKAAQSLRRLMGEPARKYCRTVLRWINQIEDYEELIKQLHKYEDERIQLIIDEFWRVIHQP